MNNNVDNIKIIIKQLYPDDSIIKTLCDIANTDFNKQQLDSGGILSTMIDAYNYGVINGKRQERAMHKKNSKSNAGLDNPAELKADELLQLEEIYALKLQNLKPKNSLEKINSISNTTNRVI